MNLTKNTFLLITVLVLTPFVTFLGKNSLQTEFFTTSYFWYAFFYCLFFFCAAAGTYTLLNRNILFLLFLAYLSFLQFYFFDIRKSIWIFKYGNTGYYVLALIIFMSLIATIISRYIIFRNFVLILLFLNLSLSVIKLIPAIGKSLLLAINNPVITKNNVNSSNSTLNKHPNIFYIVPDGMASPQVLKNYVNIEFQQSIKKFEEKGFSIPMHSYSSYNTTYLSLGALFAMDYPVNEKSLKFKDRSNFYPTIRDYNPAILGYLKKNNYKFVIAPPLWGGCPNSKEYRCLKPKGDTFFSNLFQDYAVSEMFQHSLIKRIFERYNKKNNKNKIDLNDSGKTVLDEMKRNSKYWNDGGIFTMVHMMIPHSYREKNCSKTNRFTYPSKDGYSSSVYCALKRIHELSDFIIENYPNATIVVQADHGVYFTKEHYRKPFNEIPHSTIDARLSIFTAVRGCNSDQAAQLNQPHIVEYIVECLINEKIDRSFITKSFFGSYEKSPYFGKVYRVTKK